MLFRKEFFQNFAAGFKRFVDPSRTLRFAAVLGQAVGKVLGNTLDLSGTLATIYISLERKVILLRKPFEHFITRFYLANKITDLGNTFRVI